MLAGAFCETEDIGTLDPSGPHHPYVRQIELSKRGIPRKLERNGGSRISGKFT
jgi:hypothetical protein